MRARLIAAFVAALGRGLVGGFAALLHLLDARQLRLGDSELLARPLELADGRITKTIVVAVPVTSLCPCSKEIADYGAHNQRSTVTIAVRTHSDVQLTELLRVAEIVTTTRKQ